MCVLWMCSAGVVMKAAYVGDEPLPTRSVMDVRSPFTGGLVTNWEDLELVWDRAVERLEDGRGLHPGQNPVLLAEPPLNPGPNRERMAEMMFETFDVPSLCLVMDAVLAMHASGHTTGVVVQSGDSGSQVVPMYMGYALPHAIRSVEVGGQALTQYLASLLNDSNYTLAQKRLTDMAGDHRLVTAADLGFVCGIKEREGYVALDFEAALAEAAAASPSKASDARGDGHGAGTSRFLLPDGNAVVVGTEVFRCPEALMQPRLVLGRPAPGLAHLVHASVQACTEDIRGELCSHVLLAGGSTLFPGLPQRLSKDLTALVSDDLRAAVRVVAPPNRNHLAWIGGCIFASRSDFPDRCISRAEYEEVGAAIVHRKL